MRKLISIAAVLTGLALPIPAAAQQRHVRVNCSGSSYTGSRGQLWEADHGFSGSTTSPSQQMGGTADQLLHQTGRVNGNGDSALVCSVPVANSSYHVKLMFGETSKLLEFIRAHVFNVKLQGNLVFSNLDFFAAAGANAALGRGADVPVHNAFR